MNDGVGVIRLTSNRIRQIEVRSVVITIELYSTLAYTPFHFSGTLPLISELGMRHNYRDRSYGIRSMRLVLPYHIILKLYLRKKN